MPKVAVVRASNPALNTGEIVKSITEWEEVSEDTYELLYKRIGAYRYISETDEYLFLLTRPSVEVYVSQFLEEEERAKRIAAQVSEESEKRQKEMDKAKREKELKLLEQLKEKYE